MILHALLNALLGLLLAPLMVGVINRTKAKFAGRLGQPLLQGYFDLLKLLRKGAVYSRSTTWVFRAGPIVGLTAATLALLIIPMGGAPGVLHFSGDLLLFAYLFALMRFLTILAALDTGSAFEGMGASREATFSALAEPGLLLGLALLAREAGSLSLTGIFAAISIDTFLAPGGMAILLVAAAFAVIFLSENSRIPIDDPNTHLELTMIHEVMVLDHSGPDFAFIQYAAALKIWILGLLLIGPFSPSGGPALLDSAAAVALLFLLAIATGIVESVMARLRLDRVPLLLISAIVLSLMAMVLLSVSGNYAG